MVTGIHQECHASGVGRPTNRPLSPFGKRVQLWLDGLGKTTGVILGGTGGEKIDATSLSHWMRLDGKGDAREPGYTYVATIAKRLGITVDQLLYGEPGRDALLTVGGEELRLLVTYQRNKKFRKDVNELLERFK